MKVAITRREYITHLDGVNRFAAWLAEGLRKLGHDPVLVSWCYSEQVPRERLESWFREKHGLDSEIPIYTLREKPCRGGSWARMSWEWWARGGPLLKELGADVALVNGVVPLRFKPKAAVAHGIHSSISRAQRLVLKAIYSTYDVVVCVSEASRAEYRGIAGCDHVIPLPMKLELYKPRAEREEIVVHIGTRPIKNPHISMEAVERLRERGVKAELYVIGARAPYVEKLAAGRPHVRLLFDADEREKIDVLCRAKALVLPSSGEAFSITAVEAMACGTPPVVSAAVPDSVVVHGVSGLRIDAMDPARYADALEELFRDGELWARLSKGGRGLDLDHAQYSLVV
ncbi:MAG: glycosyltransferase family 4 protein [Thermofilaceae archaeon]|uniref:glycosyltransferase family 4 protein n=1 Tax=Pyrobaculum sp. TaxID=2004705 RepID=UPI0031795C22